MKVTGCCHCKKVAYEAEIDPAQRQVWCQSRLDWAIDIADVPGIDRQ